MDQIDTRDLRNYSLLLGYIAEDLEDKPEPAKIEELLDAAKEFARMVEEVRDSLQSGPAAGGNKSGQWANN